MVLITSPTVRCYGHCLLLPAVRSPGSHRYSRRRVEISAVDRCKPWPTIDCFNVRAQERLHFDHKCEVRRRPVPAAIEREDDSVWRVLRILLWTAEAVYILWLFLLPFAPGDPVWAISSETVNSLVGLSLNFFFILPLTNSAGVHLLEAPVLHPEKHDLAGNLGIFGFLLKYQMAEGLFNFVVAWTLMFAPLLYTDRRRDRFKGSLDVLWSLMMFLTNTFLIPYMAIRLNEAGPDEEPSNLSQLGDVMTKGAPIVGLTGAAVCLLSALWSLFGRGDSGFGDIMDRWQYLIGYLGSERFAYAFVWDICLYTVFQPWLIGENLQNVKNSKAELVNYLRFVPVVGLAAYLLFLNLDEET